jgi:CDP-glycerol glycerophosphotransferase (TagB/SpsB family)
MPQKADLSNPVRLARVAAMNLTALNLARLVPRSPKKWLFGHQGELFAGNTKYLFLWMKLHRPDINIIWLAHNVATYRLLTEHGLPCELRWSAAGIRAALRAKVFLFCHGLSDTNSRLSKGAYLVNLWHGVGLKSTMFGDKNGVMNDYRRNWSNFAGRLLFYEHVTQPDIVATTSDFMQQHFAEQFELPLERCPQLGYPRLDVVADPALRELAVEIDESFGFNFNAAGHQEVYLYMPTRRDTDRPFIEVALPDFARLSAVLAERNAILYVKLHPWTSDTWPGDLDNIKLWPNDIEVYTYLDRVTALITDYSSILYDYMFTRDTGVILYTFDYDNFIEHEHTILYPFDENTAGTRADDFSALCEILSDGRSLLPDAHVAAVRQKFWGDCVAPMSPRVVDYIENMLKQ